jgi:hypothetical protein
MTETVQQYHHLDHEVLIHKRQYRDAMLWCEAQFSKRWEAIGYRAGTWTVFWAGRDQPVWYRFCFALEQDLLLFVLRWA